MSTRARMGARLLFRVEPLPLESPRGYLCRVAQVQSYNGPRWLAEIAGLPVAGLERENRAQHIAHVLRLEPEEWLAMSYRHVKRSKRFEQRSFYGQTVGADQFNYRHPRICPSCLRERPVWWAIWDLALVAACPKHRCLLINQCTTCGKKLVWHRPAVHQCRCGADLCMMTTEAASADLVAMNTIIYRAAGFPPGAAAELELTNYHFPVELTQLTLGSLLRLIRFVGLIGEENTLRRKQRPFPRTDPIAAIQAAGVTIAVLRDWPRPLREMLKRMVQQKADDPAALRFREMFGNFYRHLFCVLPRSEFGFLHDAFERFVIEDWKGLVRGQHRLFSMATRRNSYWMTAEEAEKTARMQAERIAGLVRSGDLAGMFIQRGRLSECWIKRESLNRWIASRDAELARYMSRPEAKHALGLANCTMLTVAAAGLIRHVEGPGQNFPGGCFFFLREDVVKIKHAFEKHAVPAQEYSQPGELIALRHAVKNYLGRDSGLPGVIRAVVDGILAPVAYTKRFPGITGYLFLSNDLRKYRPVKIEAPPGGFLNYKEAAYVLGTRTEVIRGLVASGILRTPNEYRCGFSKLVPAGEVQGFAEQYVDVGPLGKRSHTTTQWIKRCLQESGVPILEIALFPPKGHKIFIPKELAANVQIPQWQRSRSSSTGLRFMPLIPAKM